jgi:hypothetical protein
MVGPLFTEIPREGGEPVLTLTWFPAFAGNFGAWENAALTIGRGEPRAVSKHRG